MALSAASPFYRGHVSDIDCRWGVISASVDDRTQEERGLKVRGAENATKKNVYLFFFLPSLFNLTELTKRCDCVDNIKQIISNKE